MLGGLNCLSKWASGASTAWSIQSDPFSEAETESDEDRTVRLFHQGKFLEAIASATAIQADLGKYSVEEKWSLLIIESHLAIGEYEQALSALDVGLKRFPNSIRHRWIGIQVYQYNGKVVEAARQSTEIAELSAEKSWLYRGVPNQIILGKYFTLRGADAKQILETFYLPNLKRTPNPTEVLLAIGELALSKGDYAMAADNYQAAVKLEASNPAAHFGVALSFLPSDSEKANSAVESVLRINAKHLDALLLVIDQHISAERYEAAESSLAQVLAVNSKHPVAWAYRSVLAHLANDPEKEGEYRGQALAHWIGNPEVDHTIGRELSEKYRFQEGEAYQRRALIYDKDFLPAKIQLAHDLLRLGQELEGWKLADEVFDADQYNVVAHNLVMLRDQISKFKTLERDGFVVRMEASEAEIYGEQVLQLLVRAKKTLCGKYDAQLEMPVFIEVFPRQQDFAIRTFGLPGGAGFLGVCFGRVVTMNSPAAQGANKTSWESVLWHEFCHVVTLQKTQNKMPRWLSEGISVYEERLADSAWGNSINSEFRKMLLDDQLTPVSKLSGAFLRPPSGLHLQFAYYESSLVVEFLVNEFGIDALKDVLNDLSIGTPINDALRRHCAPVEFIDKEFAEFAVAQANTLAPDANWAANPTGLKMPAADWLQWNLENKRSLGGLISEATQWISEEKFKDAVTPLQAAIQLSPGSKQAYKMLSAVYQKLEDADQELVAREAWAKLEASDVELYTRLLELTSAKQAWEKTKFYARRLTGVNPLIVTPYRYLAVAAEKTADDPATIRALGVLAKLDPLDVADVNFRLASALHRNGYDELAKRHVLIALEQAPRYRDAHKLLLTIIDSSENKPE
ncbi:MAG: tetratricopeptide (TPR) repeat protein, partial [Mariniblastus sp.]